MLSLQGAKAQGLPGRRARAGVRAPRGCPRYGTGQGGGRGQACLCSFQRHGVGSRSWTRHPRRRWHPGPSCRGVPRPLPQPARRSQRPPPPSGVPCPWTLLPPDPNQGMEQDPRAHPPRALGGRAVTGSRDLSLWELHPCQPAQQPCSAARARGGRRPSWRQRCSPPPRTGSMC